MKAVLMIFAATSFLLPGWAWAQEDQTPQTPPATAEAKPSPQISPQRQQQLERLFEQLQKAYNEKDFQKMERLLSRQARRRSPMAPPDQARPFGQAPRRLRERPLRPQAGPWQNRQGPWNRFENPYGPFRQGQGRSFRPMDTPPPWAYRGRPGDPYAGPRWFRPWPQPRPYWNPDSSGWNRPGRLFREGPVPDFWAD